MTNVQYYQCGMTNDLQTETNEATRLARLFSLVESSDILVQTNA